MSFAYFFFQLLRKRHIGNDIVTIVFQEPGAQPFSPKNIRSHFQHVFVIVRVHNPCTDSVCYRYLPAPWQQPCGRGQGSRAGGWGAILLRLLKQQWEVYCHLLLSLNYVCGWPIHAMMSPDGVDIAQTRWLDTCCFHLHLLLRWCPWSIPSGHQLITHLANYTLHLVWQEQRRMM